MRSYLLDANVLIAVALDEHEHHARASTWLASVEAFALRPVVEGALVRFVVRLGESAATAAPLLNGFHEHLQGQFWPDELSFSGADLTDVHGLRQVTDAYLASLAGRHGALLATFDHALSELRPSDVHLIAASGQR